MNEHTTTTSTPPPPPPAPVPPLVRPREGRVIAGVAAGVAARLGVGTGWVRAAFVISCFFGGLGFVLYAVGWLAIPGEGMTESIAVKRAADIKGSSRWVGVALIAVGVLLVLSWTDVVRAEVVWAGALILVGVLLYRGELAAAPRHDTAPPPPPPPPPAHVPDAVSPATAVATTPELPAPPPPPAPPAPPTPKRPRSRLGALTLAAMFITVGALALAHTAGALDLQPRHYVGSVVAVGGLGLVVGAWYGRSRALIALGLLLLPALFVTSVVRVPLSNDFGEKIFRPQTAAAVSDVYRLGAGELTVDVHDVVPVDGPVSFEATVGAGQLTVIVPVDAVVAVDGRVGFGQIEVFGVTRAGVGRTIATVAPVGTAPDVDISVEVGFGELRVVRGSR